MAQDVFSKMADDSCVLKEDGYLNADTDLKKIVYHPSLNVIIICTKSGNIHVIDVNSGVVLHSSNLSAENHGEIVCRYVPGQDRVLFCDGQAIGVRSDYNGVLLLDTILQKPVASAKDEIKLELLLSEAIILKKSLSTVSTASIDYVINELTDKISEAQIKSKKGIKAQKWNTVCLELPLEILRAAANSSITELLVKNQHVPELGVASAVQERLAELMNEPSNVSDRRSMASEAKRRETFTHWPHMDYKWALPDQMAQAGFYHQPNSAGDDRAMCFTCTVCLVCWERTDEPWSEHERHSPNCPFVMGEYTQNVPLSVTYATNPAIDATYRSVGINTLGASWVPNLLPTANRDGLISVFDISGKASRTHSFFVTHFDSHILEKFTQDFGVPAMWTDIDDVKDPTEKKITSLAIVGDKVAINKSNSLSTPRPTIICGLKIRCRHSTKTKNKASIETLNDQNKNNLTSMNIMDIDEIPDNTRKSSCLYLVVYDFLYKKELFDKDNETLKESANNNSGSNKETPEVFKTLMFPYGLAGECVLGDSTDLNYIKPISGYIIKQQTNNYQTLIPGESDEIFLPPSITPKHSGPRALPVEMQTETDSAQATSLIIPPDYSFMNGPLSMPNVVADKSISDHIIGLKNSKTAKKLNYSRAVQCVCIPQQYKTQEDMEISEILPTQDGSHILVILNSTFDSNGSVLLLYSLSLNDSMVKLVEEPILVRELSASEKPIEVNLLNQLDRTLENTVKVNSVEGMAILVCADGVVRIIELQTLKTLSIAKLENEKFTSAAYCNSLERLCASTANGSLHFYALNDTDSDSTEDHDDDDFFSLNSDLPSVSAQALDSLDASEVTRCFHEPPDLISLSELKRLYSLCHFEAFKPGFCAVVPPCWSDMQQAQRQRRHPQHLQLETEQYTKTWRLQNDTTTWDEHVFEITLPAPVCIGHVDVHFTLQSGSTNPGIEVTLLRQNTNSIGHRRDVRFAVDEAVTFDSLRNWDNPVTSQEYLRSHNADILAGPVDIASSLDLSDQSGCLTLTSPKLFKSRNRTLLIHIKAVSNFCRDEPKSGTSSKSKNRNDADKNSGGARKTEYMGCDCIHELSVTVYSTKHTEIPHERTQRSSMLESNVFAQSLLLTSVKCSGSEPQSVALDILNWIASIRLTRNRSQMGEPPTQQSEFLKIVESNLDSLLRECLLLGGRSIAHKCVKLIAICSNGAKNIYEISGSEFDLCVFNALLNILDSIQQIKSSGSLQWLITLIYKVAEQSHSVVLASKCIDILTKIADELIKRTNPYHLLLRSRFGLYGTPLEPELFDIDAPSTAKASSSSITYASVVSGETVAQTECAPAYINRENLDPKDILTTSGDLKIKLKNLSPSKVFRGLLETEPLHFTCISASDGTRLERADAGNNGMVNNICPITVYSNSGTKKVDFEHLFGDITELGTYKQEDKTTSNGQGSSNSSNSYEYAYTYPMLISHDNSKKEDFDKLWTLAGSVDQENLTVHTQTKTKRAEEILSPNKTLPWQQLLVSPPQQVIVVERMHSGARRFVTLDFGQPILLTDVMIPASHDLVSISIDLWLKSEDADGLRLVVSSDIGNRDLLLNDLQPSPLCRYMKITAVGRYGMSTTRCRIPIGNFYGHLIVLPEEISPEHSQNINKLSHSDLENQLNILTMLFEDVSCRYSLACSKLKDLLHPFLMSDSSNAAHLSAYMETIRDRSNGSIGTLENMKIVNVYQEAVTYQRQINIVRVVMARIEKSISISLQTTKINSLGEACTDKLRIISEGLLEVLLSIDAPSHINLEICQKLFQGLCISQRSRVQIFTAALLDRSCRRQPYWGNFLADTLATMFSSSYTENFPQDRVFVLLAYLVRKSADRSAVLDATLRVISQALLPMTQNQQSLLAVTVDLPLLGWLLLFLSLQLDLCKGSQQNANRWDWVTGEMAGKSNSDNINSNYRKKLHKRFIQYKQQLDNLDFTHKVVQTSAQVQALSAISNHAANLTSKLEAALKHQENFFKKIKQYKVKESKCDIIDPSKQSGKKRKDTSETSSVKQNPQIFPQRIDSSHCLAVSKGLLSLLLAIDHSCSADMFLLSCKVIARLVRMSGLTLANLMTEEQLSKLINLCIGSELPWAPHALACLLQDIVNVAFAPNPESDMETDPAPPSTSWGSDILSDVESLCDSFDIEDQLIAEQITKPSNKTSALNNHSTPLSSVYESDDSEFEDFLDDILERGRSLLKKPLKTSYCAYSDSCAIDSRLESTVELQAEVTLRRLISLSSYSLLQNINAPVIPIEAEYELSRWPPELIIPWQEQIHSNTRNRNMLVTCFDNLFKTLQVQPSTNIEHILQLWLTLSLNADEKFNPNSIPFIALSPEAVNTLISAITWSPGLSLRTWCSALQTLTLICNIMHGINGANSEWSENFGLYCRTGYIVNHPDFIQMLLRLLSGTGLIFSDKGLAGPSLCRALHDFIVRLHMRCDVVSPTSQAGSLVKSLLLKIIYQLVQPSGPLNARQGPLDAQCKLLQTMVYLDYTNADLGIVISILECTGVLVHSYVSNSDRIKCVNIGERLSQTSHSFSGIFASVLGGETNKQDRPVSWDMLLISLLKLLAKLIQTPLPNIGNQPEAMETETSISSQTDESKAEQIHQDTVRSNPPIPCLADTVLQHHPSIIRLCQALAACKASSLSMLANISQQSTIADLGEPTTVGDAVFNLLAALARKASQKALVMEPLLIFLSQAPQLSEPLLWFILQVLDTEDSLTSFVTAGGIKILGQSLVRSSNAPNTVSHASTVSMVMQHFVGFNARSDASTAIAASSSTKKLQQACLENNLSLVNFAPYGSIRCQSGTAHPADVLIQGGTATHRRARTPQWSYHFYPEETHTELTLQLPSAVLLREVHLQPHLSALATCPSAVALEVSADGPSRLVPACPPLPTSGMTFIRLHLPIPEVVNCIQLRLYKPRDANNIGLSQIRLLGTSAFGGNVKQQILDLSEDESHCKYSLGWLRLLHHCFTLSIDEELQKSVVSSAAHVPNLLSTCCGLLLVPTHIPSLYLPNLEKVLCELSLYDRQNGLNVIRILLNSRLNGNDPINVVLNLVGGKILMNSAGSQSACELLYQICGHQDRDTPYRVALMLEWLQRTSLQAIHTKNLDTCSSAYISCIASIIWTANQMNVNYNLAGMVTPNLFNAIYKFNIMATKNIPLKCALDSLLCSLCYIKSENFPLLLQNMGVLVPNLSTDHGASISDDQKDSEGMTDDSKQIYEHNSEWYGHLVINDLPYLDLSNDQLETIALVSRSPTAVQQLLDSGLPKLLNSAVLQFCNMKSEGTSLMSKLDKVTVILKFFANVSEEKLMRDWLGSPEGSSFWLPLLQFLCKRSYNRKSVHSENFAQLEEVVVRFLSRVCLCHPNNQALLAKVLCEVIAQQTSGITGFMRRLILQLLLENEKIPVSIKANETLYKNSTVLHPYLPLHPAFKQTHDRALLYLGTNVMIGDILIQYISFSTSLKAESPNKKDVGGKNESLKSWWSMTVDSDISMAAGVTAKDKRAKDAKNQVTATPQLKKKRYTCAEGTSGAENFDGRVVKCNALPDQILPVNLTLAQLLRMIEDQGITTDWPCIHLTIYQSKGTEDEIQKLKLTPTHKPLSSALQVFSSMGGLALLAQHLPTVYPETIRSSNVEKPSTDSTESDWVKVEGSDDIYEDLEEPLNCTTPKTMKSPGAIFNVPPHSLTAFGLFLRLPGYAEVLLRDTKKALCLLRLVLGVTDDGEGGDIFQTSVADSLPTLPFEVLKKLYEATPLTTDDGRLLRRISINIGVVHLLLACLGIFTHQTQSNTQKEGKAKDDRSQLYWAKGTGFGTGSTQQSWNVEQALLKQRSEEEHVTVLLQVLSSYINPGGENDDELGNGAVLPSQFPQLLSNSALLPALSSYLRNDSVLDMARHIPLYRAALEILRALAISCQLVNLLLPQKSNNGPSINSLLKNMKTCVDTYASKLRSAQTHKKNLKKFNGKPASGKYKFKTNEQLEEIERDEGLAMLMPDIQLTATLVCNVTDKLTDIEHEGSRVFNPEQPILESLEERYLKVMKALQFDTYEMIQELPEGGYKFVISHHFENNARTAGDQSSPARVKRLAQEAVTLVTSLPLSYSSSVFVRCDTDRLDIMKVLITGPAETPYGNGCFELDVYFPPDYPQAPMMINLETTGHHSVRFNPNLYNDGKVCLSVLNTWHGRPEEKWNPQTSSFLQVLVSIQSLILVPEPYFNEPGYERSRGTPSGTQSSKEYNANICQATVRWAMLEQIVNPCPCFKEVINAHFYLKRDEIIEQIENWIKDLENDVAEKRVSRTNNKRSTFSTIENFKKVFQQLKEKLMKLTPPPNINGESSTSSMEVEPSKTVNGYQTETQDIDNDIDMEKMVNDMCE